MRAKLTILAVGLAVLGLFACSKPGPPVHSEGWLTSYEEAVQKSKETGKPILMDFTGSNWCGWCIKLRKEVFDTPEFAKWADENVVLLELDFPQGVEQAPDIKEQNHQLMEKYQVEGFPTILFVTSEGKVLGRYGYDTGGPSSWTSKAGEMIKG
ncbi:MAG: thioredoxin family protein [Candidatus Eremiobacteraeota bacterium]|nr:thioredoxin family protein [Candidatus Eremiobacteraeota bacterium]